MLPKTGSSPWLWIVDNVRRNERSILGYLGQTDRKSPENWIFGSMGGTLACATPTRTVKFQDISGYWPTKKSKANRHNRFANRYPQDGRGLLGLGGTFHVSRFRTHRLFEAKYILSAVALWAGILFRTRRQNPSRVILKTREDFIENHTRLPKSHLISLPQPSLVRCVIRFNNRSWAMAGWAG